MGCIMSLALLQSIPCGHRITLQNCFRVNLPVLSFNLTLQKWLPMNRGGTNRVFGKPCFCPLPKRARFDENGENDEFAFYPLKTMVSLLRPLQTTKMTKMAGVTQEKAWFRESRFGLP